MRYSRQNKILEIIKSNEVDTQEKLASLLGEAGFRVTQATVSRDIKELQLIKTPSMSGKSCYAVSEKPQSPVSERFKKILKETIQSVKAAENLIVIKTLSGCANAAAEAVDTTNFPQIIGTLAGDNTILIIVDKKEDVHSIIKMFEEMIQ